MPFPRSIIEEARHRAHYRCVICHAPFVDVHHIILESEGGTNTLDNAAPLCARCHDSYGNNPDKRNQIRGMRDLWYDICATRYKEWDAGSLERMSDLYEMTKSVKEGQEKYSEILNEIKISLGGTISHTAANIGSSESLSALADATSGYIVSGKKLAENVYANVHCPKCKSYIGLLVGTNKCPNCGKPIS